MADALPEGLPEAISVTPPVADGNEPLGPFLVHFPSGFRPGKDSATDWRVYRHKTRRMQHVLVASTHFCDFVGVTHGRDRSGAPTCVYAVGRLDIASGKMTYHRVPAQHVIRMEPRVAGMEYGATAAPFKAADAPADATVSGDDDKLTRKVATKRLVEQFGSTRRKRQMTSKEMAAVDQNSIQNPEQVNALLEAAHERAVAGATTKDEIMAAVASARNVPPHHPEATTGEDAYRLRELVPASAWHALDPKPLLAAARAAATGEDSAAATGIPDYVRSRLRLLTAPGVDKKVFKKKSKALGWLSAMLALHQSGNIVKSRSGVTDLARHKKLPVDVAEAVLDLFYTRSTDDNGAESFARSEAKKTLMLHYIFVTALLLEDCQLAPSQFDALRKQLKMRPADMASRFRELGATATPMKLGAAAVSSPGEARQYHVALLPASAAATQPQTLADAFPKLKVGRRAR